MDTYKIGLLSLNLGFAPNSVEEFTGHIDTVMRRAAANGAQLLMIPEYAVEACLAFKPEGMKPTEEIPFLAKCGAEFRDQISALPKRYGLHVCLGSFPIDRGEGKYTNTSVLLTRDGRQIEQDKLCLTPGEQDADSWTLEPGAELTVFDLDGLKVAILICLDVEMPAHSSLLAKTNIDLLLVPSMTERLAGFHRVYDCAKARAVELMTSVAVCGVIGAARGTTQNETNVSGAALFVPCEEELGHRGVAAFANPTDGEDGQDIYIEAEVPVGIVRQLRSGEAEVWPGAWTADHVTLRT
ncbi:nitrilase/cyanide hydratase and apolipoprotein N-acyltransferase [Roseibium sp. TrichSKD4]|uniref:nitrilase-related carbon-nitrogen hydrolase n=1 Tax=Roseibium sp. TrichSKD4 TaxID=744980 RepID=UPI0001E5727E|nr:nitrilase-related carbon-nitrogen hydrolase [Roseibium sp. TrichSKD4]EFO29714.1 nitrilase/cyanide hydratase and apolipoprotein N-acyltransferase [Roseibium sp. TrichSKD4]